MASSLIDALLNEPYRDPRRIFIAVRADGQLGTGTIGDPFDGGTRQGAETSGALSFDPYEVIALANGYHGYTDGQLVRISGVTGPGASLFNQVFAVTVVNEREFKFRLADIPSAPP